MASDRETTTKKHNTVVWEGWCSIEIPAEWTWSQDGNLINVFYESEGVGVLQLSFARKQGPKNPSNEEVVTLSLSFAESQGWEVAARAIEVNRVDDSLVATMIYGRNGKESTAWRVWHIVENTRVVCITYNSARSDQDIEAETVGTVVSSFKWK